MIKRKKKKKRLNSPPPPAAPAVENSGVPNRLDVEIVCLECRAHWANAVINFGQKIKKSDFSVRADLRDRVTFQKHTGLPNCPVCGFQYTAKAMYALIMGAMNKQKMEKQLWSSTQWKQSR